MVCKFDPVKILRLLSLLALLSVAAWGQLTTADQIPTVRQSIQTNSSNTAVYPKNVVSGNLLVAMFHTRANITTPTVADTLTSTWTLRVTQGTTNSWLYIWTALANGSGADTITVTQSGGTNTKTAGIEVSNCTETVDTSATATTAPSSSLVTFPNITTSKYRDFVLDTLTGFSGVTSPNINAAYTYAVISGSTTGDNIYMSYTITGDPGTVTGPTVSTGNSVASEGVLALRSTTNLTVSTAAIPDAVSGTAYSFQMQATGGGGTNVWTTTAGNLPCGLSLSSAGVISGTPTCSNGNTITFKVTDTAAATATKNLTIQVANSTATVARLQGHSSTASNTNVFGSNVTSGSLILVTIGLKNNWDTVTLTDSLSTVYVEVPGAVLANIGASLNQFAKVYWGFAPSGGADTVTSLGSAAAVNTFLAEEFSNVQHIFDTGVLSQINSTAGGSPTSGNITAPIAETLFTVGNPSTAGATISVNSPFTGGLNASDANVRLQSGYEVAAASGTQSSVFTVSSNTSNDWAVMLMGFRPTTSGTAPASGAGIRHGVTF
jgi:hypothetical protein